MSGDYLKVEIKGLKALDRKLKKLPTEIQGKVLRSATLAGAAVVRKSAKEKVPVDEGVLQKNIATRVKRGTSWGLVLYRIGWLYGRGKANHGHLVEFGTKFQAPQPFLRPAFDENTTRIIETMRKRLAKGIERVASRL